MTTVKENKVDKETAESEFNRFINMMDLDLDTADMDVEDLNAFKRQKGKVLRAIEKGSLIINDDGEAVYTPSNPKSKYSEAITFHERTGASLMAMDTKKKNHDVAKTYAVMGDMCNVHQNVFAGLVGNDVKVCEALFALLMD